MEGCLTILTLAESQFGGGGEARDVSLMLAFHPIWICYELVRTFQDPVDLRGSPTLVVVLEADLSRRLILPGDRECMVMKMLNRSRRIY